MLTAEGVPRFELLQRHEDPAAYVAFDLLSLDGKDLANRPYERRAPPRALPAGSGRIVPRHQVGDGEVLLQVTADQGLEGIVAKRLAASTCRASGRPTGARSSTGRRRWWSAGSRPAAGTARDGSGLCWSASTRAAAAVRGGVGSGFDQKMLDALTKQLRALATPDCPFEPLAAAEVRGRHVGASRARGDRLRRVDGGGSSDRPAFLGLRDDKRPEEVAWRLRAHVGHTSGAGVAEAARGHRRAGSPRRAAPPRPAAGRAARCSSPLGPGTPARDRC